MKNPISGQIEELTEAKFLDKFDPVVHQQIKEAKTKNPTAAGMVCFECLQMDSSFLGARTACVVGPNNTIKLEALEKAGCRLGDVPSRFQYPTAIWYWK